LFTSLYYVMMTHCSTTRQDTLHKLKVYITRARGRLRYIVREGSRTILTTTRHDVAHEWIAKSLPDQFKFYVILSEPEVYEKTWALIKLQEFIPDVRKFVGVLVSYACMNVDVLKCVMSLKEHGFEVMLDSGAFHVLERKVPLNLYLQWLDQYIEFVNRHIELFDWIVTMDIPCDSRPSPKVQRLPNRTKIELTIDNTLRIIDRIVDPRKFMIVVQGYYPEEYAYCCELYKRYGIVTARVGVGSLCIRKYSRNAVQEIKQILETVKQHLPGWVKLHAFGLNIRFLKHQDILCMLHSSDSAAYAKTYSEFGRVRLFDPFSGTSKELDVVRNGVVQVLDKATIWFWILLSFVMQIKHIVSRRCNCA